jgi:hypothetical protein
MMMGLNGFPKVLGERRAVVEIGCRVRRPRATGPIHHTVYFNYRTRVERRV